MKQNKEALAYVKVKNRKGAVAGIKQSFNDLREKIDYLESELGEADTQRQANAIGYSILFLKIWELTINKIDNDHNTMVIDFMDGKHNVN